ncbi:MAG: thioredoxin family protein [Anaerolineaceae bacterium]|nr:thioredoxin family protein [Anaerolineaceae bacterium]
MEIKILGGGCPNCHRLEALAREAAADLGIEATFIKVKAMTEIMNYDIISTPALVVNETVKSSGRVPSKEEMRVFLQAE